MTTIDDIRDSIAPQLIRLNELMADMLATGNELMNGIVSNYLTTKGKQIRPILVILSAQLLGDEHVSDSTIAAAAAIEMLHNATLIHDDVVDDTDRRRGVPTINAVWDNHVAVLVGDFFVSTSLGCALRAGDVRVIEVISRLGRTLSLGEINQIDKARLHDLNEESYFDIIDDKTASLFEGCVCMGGYTAGADDSRISRLREFARLFGLCFQIRDDIFDYFADPAIGKPTGNDLREGKVTLPLLYALSRPELPETAEMRALVCRDILSGDDIDRLISFARCAGGIDYAYSTMDTLRDRAAEILSTFPPSASRDAFSRLLDYVIARQH